MGIIWFACRCLCLTSSECESESYSCTHLCSLTGSVWMLDPNPNPNSSKEVVDFWYTFFKSRFAERILAISRITEYFWSRIHGKFFAISRFTEQICAVSRLTEDFSITDSRTKNRQFTDSRKIHGRKMAYHGFTETPSPSPPPPLGQKCRFWDNA